MSKQKKRVSLAQKSTAPRASSTAPSAPGDAPPPVEEPEEAALAAEESRPTIAEQSALAVDDGGSEVASDALEETPQSRSMETQPTFWFVLGSLTVGIIVMLGLLLMDSPAASAKPAPVVTATHAVAKPSTATAVATALRPAAAAPTADVLATVTAAAVANAAVPRISLAETKAKLDAGTILLVDVRPKASYDELHAKGAINIPQDETETRLSELPKDKDIVLYCA